MKRSLLQLKKWQAPDWKDSGAYGDVTLWSDRRWAWEFLRRNEEYQRIGIVGGPPAIQLDKGRKFGRAKIRPYWSEYSKAEEGKDVWLFDRVVAEHGWDGFDSRPQTPLAATEMVIKLDLSIVMASGEAALNILMEKIKETVVAEMDDRWGEKGFPQNPGRRPKDDDLFQYLRLIDAGDASAAELAPFLYRQYCTPSGVDDLLITSGASHISRQRSAARKMVKEGYLRLVPALPN